MTTKQTNRPITEDDELDSEELKLDQWAANLSPEQVSSALGEQWQRLQSTGSYVEGQAKIFASEK